MGIVLFISPFFFAVNYFNTNMFNSDRRINMIWGILNFWLFVSMFYLFFGITVTANTELS